MWWREEQEQSGAHRSCCSVSRHSCRIVARHSCRIVAAPAHARVHVENVGQERRRVGQNWPEKGRSRG